MPQKSKTIEDFWRKFCETTSLDSATRYQVWFFGNTSEMARELAELVISGKKRATASLVDFNKIHPEAAPIDDGYSLITDFEGHPQCVIQTTEIRHWPFTEVDAEFAFDEGEGDRSVEDWRQAHRRYFTNEAAEFGFEFNEKSLICCERFKLLFSK